MNIACEFSSVLVPTPALRTLQMFVVDTVSHEPFRTLPAMNRNAVRFSFALLLLVHIVANLLHLNLKSEPCPIGMNFSVPLPEH